MKTKICSKCKIDKPHSDYFKDNKREVGIRCKCKACCKQDIYEWRAKNKSEYNNYAASWRAKNPSKQHATEIKKHYGLSIEQYNQMLADQKLMCKICDKQHDPSIKRGRLYVDHNHVTGAIRGLLCSECNFALGKMNDRIDLLEKAIAYLKS
jgi:hypothetical protein